MGDCFCLKVLYLERLSLSKKAERLPMGDLGVSRAFHDNWEKTSKITNHKVYGFHPLAEGLVVGRKSKEKY